MSILSTRMAALPEVASVRTRSVLEHTLTTPTQEKFITIRIPVDQDFFKDLAGAPITEFLGFLNKDAIFRVETNPIRWNELLGTLARDLPSDTSLNDLCNRLDGYHSMELEVRESIRFLQQEKAGVYDQEESQ